jgi:phage tail sheath protein FI
VINFAIKPKAHSYTISYSGNFNPLIILPVALAAASGKKSNRPPGRTPDHYGVAPKSRQDIIDRDLPQPGGLQMPVSPTYPGVYIQEIPSGVRTITGVATSITAFVGRAARGPVDEPVTINSFGDYQRVFGGLDIDSTMSYAVRDFFLNGGGQAIIVRLFTLPKDAVAKARIVLPSPGGGNVPEGESDPDASPPRKSKKTSESSVSPLTLEAAYPGGWGNKLRARVTEVTPTPDWAEAYSLAKGDFFNLAIHDDGTGVTETFLNVTLKESPRRLDRVLENESNLVRVWEGQRGDNWEKVSFPTAHPDPAAGKRLWDDDPSSTGVTDQALDSDPLTAAEDYTGDQANKRGIYALEKADLFNLLCIPPDTRGGKLPNGVDSDALDYCVARRAMLIVDSPNDWRTIQDAQRGLTALNLSGQRARNAALYFPRVRQADPLRNGQIDTFVPCGIIAGIMSRTDVQRGVWKAPAGLDAALSGIQGLEVNLTDAENGMLNPLGINCLRSFPVAGTVVWGARTLRGADQLADEYKYVPVRRLALYIEESLYRGTQWVVFEPNDEPLWAQIRLNVGAFMHNLFRQGAFQGQTPRDAYFVKCDKETTTQNDINLGIVNIVVGFAPLKPAEFVIISIQQIAGAVEA